MLQNAKPFRLFLAVLVVCLSALTTIGVSEESKNKVQIIEDISPSDAQNMIRKNSDNPDFIVLDVRTQQEYRSGYIEGALNVDFYSESFLEELKKLDRTKTYVIYCRSGNRSGRTLEMVKELGFQKVYNIVGGIIGWNNEGLPLSK